MTTFDLLIVSPKKHSIRFDTKNPDAPVRSVYVDTDWVREYGAENGVRITIEPVPDNE